MIRKNIFLFLMTSQVFGMPLELFDVPFADQEGIVLEVKEVPIRSIEAPYNASLIEGVEGNYFLFFRYDLKKKGKLNYIAAVELNEKLEQKGDFKNIDTHSDYSNDPRVIKTGSHCYLIYNDIPPEDAHQRIMKMGEIDLSNFQLSFITDLDRKIRKVEKNWTPFVENDEVHFIYTIDPYHIIKLQDPRQNTVAAVTPPSYDFLWDWGPLRGGTPAILVDGEYLTFFHSSFKDQMGRRWYVMGAMSFEAKSPFKITGISPYPILFKGIYNSPHLNGASGRLRCIFPSGIVLSRDGNKIVVSCGENDSAVKVITFDKGALLKSLIKY